MARWLHMHDLLTVRRGDMQMVYKLKDAKSDSLLTKVRATTAGIVNGNRRFYRPDRMQDSVHTWTPSKPRSPKPVLIGHNDDGQVLGRVVSAKYVDESYKYKSEHTQIRDSAFYASDNKKKLDVFKSIDWIVDNLLPREDYAGLGYIELGLNITNPDAVAKVMRDEYMTVSVGFRTDSAICSICHTDWSQDDRCEHEMGEKYDGKSMFLVTGNFQYDEVSFVNFPADPFASTISKDKLGDSLGKLFFLGLPMRQQLQLTQSTGLKFSDSLYAADIRVAEETMAETNTTVDPKLEAELGAVAGKDMTKEEQDAAVAEASGAKPAEADAKIPDVPVETGVTVRVGKVIAKVLTLEKCKGQDATGSEIAKLISDLDKAYDSFEDDKKYIARMAVSSMMDDWYADSSFEYYTSQLSSDKDFVMLRKADHKVETDKLAAAEGVVVTKDAEIGSLKTQVATVFSNYKRSLADKIVIFKALSGAKDFQGLDAAALQTKAVELAKRHVSSLQDTVSDIMSELKWVEPKVEVKTEDKTTEAAREEKPAEAQPAVNDNKQVTDPVPGAVDTKVTDAEKAKRDFDLHVARLRAMGPREREVYLATVRYETMMSSRHN